MPFASHEAYFASLPEHHRARLLDIQAEVERCVPTAVRCISYNMPAFKQAQTFFYFAAFKNHVGVYPQLVDDKPLIRATAAFRGPKGNLSFPHNNELPLALIGEVAMALAVQYSAKPR